MASYFSGDVTITDGRQYAAGPNPVDTIPPQSPIIASWELGELAPVWKAIPPFERGTLTGILPHQRWSGAGGNALIYYSAQEYFSPYLSTQIIYAGEAAGRAINLLLNVGGINNPETYYVFQATQTGAGQLWNCELVAWNKGKSTPLAVTNGVKIGEGARLIFINRQGKLLAYKEEFLVPSLICSAANYELSGGFVGLFNNSTLIGLTAATAGEFIPSPSVPNVVRSFYDHDNGQAMEAPVFVSNFQLTPRPGTILALEELRIKAIVSQIVRHERSANEEAGTVQQAGGEVLALFSGVNAIVIRDVNRAIWLPTSAYAARQPAQLYPAPGGKYLARPQLSGISVMDSFSLYDSWRALGYKREVTTNAKGEEVSASIFLLEDTPVPVDVGKQYNPPIIVPEGVSLGFGVEFGELIRQAGTLEAMIKDYAVYLSVVASYRYKLYELGEKFS